MRLSKIGNARLRKALYFPAVTALRCSPFFQQWAEGLRQRGKSKMAVIGAAMRKLVHLAYGVLKTGKPFDPEWAKTRLTPNTVSHPPRIQTDGWRGADVGRRVRSARCGGIYGRGGGVSTVSLFPFGFRSRSSLSNAFR